MIQVSQAVDIHDAWLPPEPVVEIVPATEEHAAMLGRDLRAQDLASGRNATDAVKDCMSVSRAAWAAVEDGRVVCLWGIVCPSLLGSQAEIWLLCGRRIEAHVVPFLRQAREFVAEMQQQYPRLEANVAVRNRAALRFAGWLGFRRMGEFTIDGHRFASFERREA
jgi:hypothetical protein